MHFELCNAPHTFQRLMDIALRDLSWKDFDTHLERLEAVFSELVKAKLKLKPSKCKFFMTEGVTLDLKYPKRVFNQIQTKLKLLLQCRHQRAIRIEKIL